MGLCSAVGNNSALLCTSEFVAEARAQFSSSESRLPAYLLAPVSGVLPHSMITSRASVATA